eukprot:6153200-Amphidinium_carterae.1
MEVDQVLVSDHQLRHTDVGSMVHVLQRLGNLLEAVTQAETDFPTWDPYTAKQVGLLKLTGPPVKSWITKCILRVAKKGEGEMHSTQNGLRKLLTSATSDLSKVPSVVNETEYRSFMSSSSASFGTTATNIKSLSITLLATNALKEALRPLAGKLELDVKQDSVRDVGVEGGGSARDEMKWVLLDSTPTSDLAKLVTFYGEQL